MNDAKQPSAIFPNLYLGSYQHSCNLALLDRLGITHILNVKDTCKFPDPKRFTFMHVPLSDYGLSEFQPALERCVPFIESARNSGSNILVHCAVGRNRSPAIVLGYLMHSQRWNLKQSYEYLQSRHPLFAVHESYFSALQEIDRQLFGELSLTQEDIGPSVQEVIRQLRGE